MAKQLSSELFESGVQFLESGDYGAALAAFRKYVSRMPEQSIGYHHLGLAHFKLQRYHEALDAFARAIEINPSEADHYADRGVALIHLKEFERAIDDFDQAVELESENPYRHASLAYTYSLMGKNKAAIEGYEKALELDPEDEISRNNLEILLEKQAKGANKHLTVNAAGELEEDEKPVQRNYIRKEKPTRTDYLDTIARVFTSRSQFAEFIRFLFGRKPRT